MRRQRPRLPAGSGSQDFFFSGACARAKAAAALLSLLELLRSTLEADFAAFGLVFSSLAVAG